MILTNEVEKVIPTYPLPKSYKRADDFVKSPFRYPGGKFYALKLILPFLTCVPHDEYREPFVGGGSVLFGKPKVAYNWLNDLEEDLIITYKAIANKAERVKLIERLSQEVATRERHAQIKNLEVQSTSEIAFKTFYLNRTSYSGIIHNPAWGYKDGKSSPPQNWGNFIKMAGNKLEGVNITSKDFEDVIKSPSIGETVLMYLDPPYYHADQKRAYTRHFVIEDHLRLAELLKNTNHQFCLSYDDCSEIRKMYSWAEIYERTWLYNTANVKGGKRINGKELIITNYRVYKPKQMSLWE